jgi:DNA ligase 1
LQLLYRKNKFGVGSWRIWAEAGTIFIAHSNSDGGSEVVHTEVVPEGLAGRTLDEQVQSRIASRIKRQRDRGYVDSIDQAINNPLTNMLNQPPPMLAKKFDQLRGWAGRYIMQPKLDGFRNLTTNTGMGILAYTRGGIELPAITHITEALKPKMPEGITLDGEIYEHGTSLQTIASLAKRKQSGTTRLVYHVYDSIGPENFETRYADAKDIVDSVGSPNIVMVPNYEVTSVEEMWKYFRLFREQGFEGGMLRHLVMPYEPGTRSSGLIKVKEREDDDYEVIDVVPGSDGLGILVCKMPSGKTFKTLAPGDHGQKKETLLNKEKYIGRKVTVEYANLTNDGIPFHGVATRFLETL